MFERFTDTTRQLIVVAQEEAELLQHDYIGTEHLLLGLVREERGWEESAWDEPTPPAWRAAPAAVEGPIRASEVRAVVEVALTAGATKAMEENRPVDLGDVLRALVEGWPTIS